jgi:hypothetical protein
MLVAVLWQLWIASEHDHYPTPGPKRNAIREVNAFILSQMMNMVFEQMKTNRARAKLTQAKEADKDRREGKELKPGDRGGMDTRNISTQRPNRRLDWKHLGL